MTEHDIADWERRRRKPYVNGKRLVRKKLPRLKHSDPLTQCWAADNERDPEQHYHLLNLAGRKVTKRQAYQDYFRREALQRASQNRGLRESGMTEPDDVVDEASTRVQAHDLILRLDPEETLVLTFVAHGLDYPEVAEATGFSLSTVKRIMCSIRVRM